MTYVHENERMRRIILETFPNNRTVLLPQTILYETDEQKMWAEETYKDRDNLLLLVRDRISYENAKNYLVRQNAIISDIDNFNR